MKHLIQLFLFNLLLHNSGFAATLFSVDVQGDQLVKVNSVTGTVSVVGPLGIDVSGVDLATIGNAVYMLGINNDVETSPKLYQLDLVTGSAIFLADVNTPNVGGSSPSLYGEALTFLDGNLVVSFKGVDSTNPYTSNALANLDLDGSISAISQYSSGIDFDWLTVDKTNNQLIGGDAVIGNAAINALGPLNTITPVNQIADLLELEYTTSGLFGLTHYNTTKSILSFFDVNSSPFNIVYESGYQLDGLAPPIFRERLIKLPDINSDDIDELGKLKVNIETAKVTLEILSGQDQSNLKTIVWDDIFVDSTLSLHVITDMNNNGIHEVGLFGLRDKNGDEGKPQVFVRDLHTGNRVAVFNWPANWSEVSPLVLSDMTGDGIPEVAIQGRFREGNRPQLVIKNGASSATISTYSYPDLFNSPKFFQHSDVDDDGVTEISTLGRIKRNNKIQVKIANGADPKDKFKAYNFPDNWSDISWHRLDDMNGDGEDDWGLFGRNREDGRPQLIVKNGTDPKGALAIYAWPADLQDAKFFLIPDMNSDGVDEVAVGGRRSNGRYQFQIKDGANRNTVLANHNLNLQLEGLSFHLLPDLTTDGIVEIGFLGKNISGEYELIIQEGNTDNGEYNQYKLGDDWLEAPSIVPIGDTDADGLPNIISFGQTQTSADLLFMPLHNANLRPVAITGADQTVDENEMVTLSGSGIDMDGSIAKYSWVQTSGPLVVLSETDKASIEFVAPDTDLQETLIFELTVTDNEGATGSASKIVNVINTTLQELEEIIIDNTHPNAQIISGDWWTIDAGRGYEGSNFTTSKSSTGGEFRWAPNLNDAAGEFEVYVKYATNWWNLGTDAPYTVVHDRGSEMHIVDQTQNGGQWVLLGRYSMGPGSYVSIEAALSNDKRPSADAIKLVRVGEAADRRMNFVVILTDDQRWDTLEEMPILLDKIAERGVRFENAFVSTPLCGPVRANLIAGGFRSQNTGIITNPGLNGGEVAFRKQDSDTIATALQQIGYKTMLAGGKYLNAYQSPYIPPGWTRFVNNKKGPCCADWFNFNAVVGSSGKNSNTGTVESVSQYINDYHKDQVINFLDDYNGSDFFVFFSTFAPHAPAVPDILDENLYPNFDYQERAFNETDLSDKPDWVSNPYRFKWTKEPELPDISVRQIRSLQSIDRAIGEIVDKVESMGELDRTVFIFTSDNGYLWGEHGLYDKGMAYDESIRVPFIIVAPGVSPGTNSSLVMADLDIGATIFDMVGLVKPSDGESISPILSDAEAPFRTEAFFQNWGFQEGAFGTWSAMRTDKFKYIENAYGEEELYDLVADPFEEESLHNDPNFGVVKEKMANTLSENRGLSLRTFKAPEGSVGNEYNLTLNTWGGQLPFKWYINSGSLPDGVSLDPVTGLISGTPIAAGTYYVEIAVEDSSIATHSGLPQRMIGYYTIVISP